MPRKRKEWWQRSMGTVKKKTRDLEEMRREFNKYYKNFRKDVKKLSRSLIGKKK